MDPWKNCLLGDVVNLKRGYDLPHSARSPGPFPVVSSSGITDHHSEAKVKGPGVVTGRCGTLGQVFFVETDYWPLNTSLYVENFKGNDPRFVSYFLGTLNFGSQNAAGAVPGVNRNHLHAIEVRVPPIPIQRRIAGILSAYDELIENSQRRIKILESMARALYREWFVHFRFPGHESVPRIPSPLGDIPQGWEVKRLDEVCRSIQDGDWIETKDQGGEDYRLLQISNVGVGEFVETGNYRYVTQETFSRLRCNEIVPGDLLVARMPTPIGRGWLVTKMPWRMITAVDVAIIRAEISRLHPHFLVHAWNETSNLKRIAAQASGTTRLRITRRELAAMEFVIPPVAVQEKFAEVAQPQSALIETLQVQIQNLRRTRDLLLPRLLSGQIDVEAMNHA